MAAMYSAVITRLDMKNIAKKSQEDKTTVETDNSNTEPDVK